MQSGKYNAHRAIYRVTEYGLGKSPLVYLRVADLQRFLNIRIDATNDRMVGEGRNVKYL